jgi:signal transduction histidine kinase
LISVADDGTGLSERAKRHACDPFFSELSAGRRSGLGLTRARRFVELHGGKISLESKQGMGTTARIVLPMWKGQQAEVSSREAA